MNVSDKLKQAFPKVNTEEVCEIEALNGAYVCNTIPPDINAQINKLHEFFGKDLVVLLMSNVETAQAVMHYADTLVEIKILSDLADLLISKDYTWESYKTKVGSLTFQKITDRVKVLSESVSKTITESLSLSDDVLSDMLGEESMPPLQGSACHSHDDVH